MRAQATAEDIALVCDKIQSLGFGPMSCLAPSERPLASPETRACAAGGIRETWQASPRRFGFPSLINWSAGK